MFIVIMRYTENKQLNAEHRQGHVKWIKEGMDQGVISLAGGLAQEQGGLLFMHSDSRDNIESYLQQDPYITNDIVAAEIIDFKPAMAIPELDSLLS